MENCCCMEQNMSASVSNVSVDNLDNPLNNNTEPVDIAAFNNRSMTDIVTFPLN